MEEEGEDIDSIVPFRDDLSRVITPDNVTLSEELSRMSSSPSHSQSQSSSCTSITNPSYDGPGNNFFLLLQSQNISQPTAGSGSALKTNTRRSSQGHRIAIHDPQPQDTQSCFEESHQPVGDQGGKGRPQQRLIFVWNFGYLWSVVGFIQILQFAVSVASLSVLTSAGENEGGLLNLPLSWHFRLMIFVLVLTILVNAVTLISHVISLTVLLGLDCMCLSMVMYSLFAFLYLVGSSLVASAFDFYQKMKTGVSEQTINRLVTAVVLGYFCMLLHSIVAFICYRRWTMQHKLYQRRKLIEEDEIDL